MSTKLKVRLTIVALICIAIVFALLKIVMGVVGILVGVGSYVLRLAIGVVVVALIVLFIRDLLRKYLPPKYQVLYTDNGKVIYDIRSKEQKRVDMEQYNQQYNQQNGQ